METHTTTTRAASHDRCKLVRHHRMAGLAGQLTALAAVLFLSIVPSFAASAKTPITLPPDIQRLVNADDWSVTDHPRSDEVETARLRAGILCVAWARDMIDQHWRMLDILEGESTWTREREQLWHQIGWIDEFEAGHLRPRIDEDSQSMLLEAWWPDGVSTQAASEEAEEMHRFCLGLPGLLGSIDPHSPYAFDRAFH